MINNNMVLKISYLLIKIRMWMIFLDIRINKRRLMDNIRMDIKRLNND